jgi:hypothetical protein
VEKLSRESPLQFAYPDSILVMSLRNLVPEKMVWSQEFENQQDK